MQAVQSNENVLLEKTLGSSEPFTAQVIGSSLVPALYVGGVEAVQLRQELSAGESAGEQA
eukprot:1161163-Pelagomonas_calceolata.AAC.5